MIRRAKLGKTQSQGSGRILVLRTQTDYGECISDMNMVRGVISTIRISGVGMLGLNLLIFTSEMM